MGSRLRFTLGARAYPPHLSAVRVFGWRALLARSEAAKHAEISVLWHEAAVPGRPAGAVWR